MNFRLNMTLAIIAALVLLLLVGTFQHPPVITVQTGYRGLGMTQMFNPASLDATRDANRTPESTPPIPPSGRNAGETYMNVQVLKDVDANEFIRLMTDLTKWVAPQQGCAYCHANGEDFSSDKLYTKVVARRMLAMTRHINTDWKDHVATTGVTCYTCHRGQPVPANIWFNNPGPLAALGDAEDLAEKNKASPQVGFTSLPYDPFSSFLDKNDEIRVVSTTALPEGSRRTIKQTEWTYGLMMHFSQALGVNCTFCHNSRSFFAWDQSTPQRVTAFYGIEMVRDLNTKYLEQLAPQFPPDRLGPLGDGPKVNCATCHQGAYKPLFGAATAKDYPELGAALPASPRP